MPCAAMRLLKEAVVAASSQHQGARASRAHLAVQLHLGTGFRGGWRTGQRRDNRGPGRGLDRVPRRRIGRQLSLRQRGRTPRAVNGRQPRTPSPHRGDEAGALPGGRQHFSKPTAVSNAAGLNLGLLMRALIGVGTPRSLQGRAVAAWACLRQLTTALWALLQIHDHRPTSREELLTHRDHRPIAFDSMTAFTTVSHSDFVGSGDQFRPVSAWSSSNAAGSRKNERSGSR